MDKNPLERDLLDRDPPDRDPPCAVKSGRYASYWNAVLFENLLDLNVLGSDIFNCVLRFLYFN